MTIPIGALALASTATSEAGPPLGQGGGYGGMLLETLVVLLVVCGLAWLVIRFGLRRMYPPGTLVRGGAGLVQVVARLPLEPRRTIYVVSAAGRYLVVGSGEGGALSTLAELDAAAVTRVLEGDRDGGGRPRGRARTAFADLLARGLGRPAAPPAGDMAGRPETPSSDREGTVKVAGKR